MIEFFQIAAPSFNLAEVKPENSMSLYTRKFTTTLASLRHRKVFLEWQEEGLIPAIGKEWSKLADPNTPIYNLHESWRFLNFFELVWTRLVSQLRGFGYPKNEIKYFAQGILKVHPDVIAKQDDIFSTVATETMRRRYTALCRQKGHQFDEKEFAGLCAKQLAAYLSTTIFELHLQKVLFKREPLIFYATKNYGILPYNPNERLTPEMEMLLNKALSDPYIAISFLSLIDDFLMDEHKDKFPNSFPLISQKEKVIVDLLRGKRLKQVVLNYSDKTETIFKAEVTTSEVLSIKTNAKAILDAIRSRQYKRVHITEINSENFYIEKEELIKL